MSSSDAPPPVEICPIFSAMPLPAALTAAALSPPPTTVNARESAIARATPKVPAANGVFSKRPIGPFQKIVLASPKQRGEKRDALRPDVERHPTRGDGVHVHGLTCRGLGARRDDDVDR